MRFIKKNGKLILIESGVYGTFAFPHKPLSKRQMSPNVKHIKDDVKDDMSWVKNGCNNIQDPVRKQICKNSMNNDISNRFHTKELIVNSDRAKNALNTQSNNYKQKIKPIIESQNNVDYNVNLLSLSPDQKAKEYSDKYIGSRTAIGKSEYNRLKAGYKNWMKNLSKHHGLKIQHKYLNNFLDAELRNRNIILHKDVDFYKLGK